MKKPRIIICILLAMLITVLSASLAMADTWEYGSGGDGENPFTPRGYVIETENGRFWLNSRFDNSDGTVRYTGIKNGIDFISAKGPDNSDYTLYAFTDRNPKLYNFLIAYKDGKPIKDFSQYVQAPGRLEEDQRLGSGANWAIPIIGFSFEPGCYYEFAFCRGMQANNGITMVFSEDGKGYIRNPETAAELAKYEADKYKEYEFMSSYWVIWNDAHTEYGYDFHLVPMRFSVQTYADISEWYEGRQEAADFLASVSAADYEAGKYMQRNVEELAAKLAELDAEAESSCKKMLQKDAVATARLMLAELDIAYLRAQQPHTEGADLYDLNRYIKEAKVLYARSADKIGTGLGQYGAEQVEGLKAALDHALTVTGDNTQSEADEAAEQLSEWITRVYASVLHEPSLILTDYATGIKLIIPSDSIAENTVLYASAIAEGEEYEQLYTQLAGKIGDYSSLLIYRLELYSGDITVHPTKKFTAQIPLPPGVRNGTVYYTPNSENAYRLQTMQADGIKVMTVRDSGYFALIYNSDEEILPPAPPKTTEIIDETELDIKDAPDENNEEITQEQGQSDRTEQIGFDEARTDTNALNRPFNADGLLLNNDASYTPLFALAVISLLAAITAMLSLIKGKKQ